MKVPPRSDRFHNQLRDSFHPARIIAEVSILSALYVALTLLLAPVSYGPIQFRVSEALVILVATRRHLLLFVPISCCIANLFSPYAGPWDLIFMPLVSMIGALPMYILRTRWLLFSSWAYAFITAVGVGIMLSVLVEKGFLVMFGPVLASQLIIMTIAFFVFRGYLLAAVRKKPHDGTNGGREEKNG
ncbi:MAG: QueT transporter family protein [Deltaproteobacteria bacterium]|nr:QueT transporter family protein [Candidatus Zymogenaceae bacterium]